MQINASVILQLAAKLKVTDKDSQTETPWVLWPEQIEIIKSYCANDRTLCCKSRQIGLSTLAVFLTLLYIIMHPGARGAIVADRESLAIELLRRAALFSHQLKATKKKTRLSLKLTNGGELVALSARADLRGRSFKCLHLTEMDSWPDPAAYGALLQTCPKGARLLVESTAKGPDGLMHSLWTKTDATDAKHFFAVQDHLDYRTDRPLTAEETTKAKELGYTDPRAAAWFFDKVNRDFKGDLIAALREFPQLEIHPFIVQEGRYIETSPPVAIHTTLSNGIRIFTDPDKSHRYLAAMDPAFGVGACKMAIAVIDRTTQRIVATYTSATDQADDAVDKLQFLANLYHVDDCTIEKNGIGSYAVREALARNMNVIVHNSSPGSVYEGLLAVKRGVEGGTLMAGPDFVEECASLTCIDRGKTREFKGHRDLLMACGFIYPRILEDPYTIPTSQEPGRFQMSKYLKPKRSF